MRPSWRRLTGRFRASVVANPFAWVLVALFLIVEYNNYSKGVEIQRIFEILGPHDVSVDNPRTDKQEIDKICISLRPDD